MPLNVRCQMPNRESSPELPLTWGLSVLSPLDKTNWPPSTKLIPNQTWWAQSEVHLLWNLWCQDTCRATMSSFSNKAVISWQCALSWHYSKMEKINSVCQGEDRWHNYAETQEVHIGIFKSEWMQSLISTCDISLHMGIKKKKNQFHTKEKDTVWVQL